VNDSPMKPRILELLRFAHQQERELMSTLSEVERGAIGTADRWSPKDFLVNIMLWKELQTQKLAMAVRGETPPEWRDMQVVNAINSGALEKYRNAPFQDVQQEAERAFAAFIAQVESLSEDELSDAARYEWANGEALWHETLGNGLWHPFSQMAALSMQRGNRETAVRLQETLLEAVRGADLPPETLGVALYNQACFYATNGWPEKALSLLPEALRIRPTLVEWSKHDSDLDSLRTDPRFQALYEDAALQGDTPVDALISAQELRASFGGGERPLIIDVRGAGEYAGGHVQGAVNIPLGQLSKKLANIPRERLVVTYCNMHHRGESRGERASAMLRERGYHARALDGGYPAWKEQGFPVEEVSLK
jgi:rhodanese-related sulfurtransferase